MLTPEFTGAIPQELLELELGQCVVRIGVDWTTIRTLPPAAGPADDPTARIVTATRQQFPTQEDEETVEEADTAHEEPEFVQ
ncbi:MAG: hypothetical protein ACYSWU_04695 [Planctomycetota bacterium]|jgi:hypothetical protein